MKNLVRKDLQRGAAVARKMGLQVDASKFDGRISSYYVTAFTPRGRRQFRISDHDIPNTECRTVNESFDGGADVYASARKHRRRLWWERAFKLLIGGRIVPQFEHNFPAGGY